MSPRWRPFGRGVESAHMIETLATGLILAAVTGLTVIAYKHPQGYNRIHGYLYAGAVMIYIAVMAWSEGVGIAYSEVTKFIPVDKQDAARKAIDAVQVSFALTFFVFVGVAAYLIFLSLLPGILGLDKEKPAG